MESTVYHYLTLSLSDKELNKLLKEIVEIGQTSSQEIVDYSETLWKKYKLHQEGLRFLKMLTLLTGYDKAKLLPTLYLILEVIDRSKIKTQYKAACRFISKIITIDDLPKNMALSAFGVLSYMKVNDNAKMAQLADSFGECIIKLTIDTPKNLPSFLYAKVFSQLIPKDIFIDKVIPKIERQLLRSGEKFTPVASRIMPRFDFSVTPKSLAQTLLNLISSKADKTTAPKDLERSSQCYNIDELYKASLTTLKSCSNFESRVALSLAISKFNPTKINDETLKMIVAQIKDEKQQDVQNNLILSLEAVADRSFPLIKEITINSNNINSICSVLCHSTPSADVSSFIRSSFKISPPSVARVILYQGEKLTNDESEAILGSSKYINEKFESLLMCGKADKCLEIFLKSPSQFINNALSVSPEHIAPLVESLMLTPSLSDDILLKFTKKVKQSPSSFNRVSLCLLWPSKTTKEDVPSILEVYNIRRNLAGRALSEVGFTKEQYDYVKGTFDQYFRDPLRDEDIHILLCTDEVDTAHSSAEKYVEMKEEIAHPNAKTNLPQLKKQIEKVKAKVLASQAQIKENLTETCVKPVIDSINLLIFHYKNEKKPITASLTAFTNDLLRLIEIEVFSHDVEKCLISCLNRVPAFRTMPRTILSVLMHDNETIDIEMLKYLVPTGALSDVMLHMIASDLPALLSSEYAPKFCDINAISPETDVELLLPIYLEHSNFGQEILEFSVYLCKDISATHLKVAFDHMMDDSPNIRMCALNCIGNAIFDVNASQLFICQLHVLAVSEDLHELAFDLIQTLKYDELTIDNINEAYTKLFNLNSKDETLQRDIGISYGRLTLKHVNEAVKFLISLYTLNSQKTESYNIPIQNNVRYAISFAFLELKPMTPECISFITLTALRDSVDTVRENMTKICEHYISSFDKKEVSNLFESFYEALNLPPVTNVENNRFRISLVKLCSKIVDIDFNEYSSKLLECLMKYNIRSIDDELREIAAKTISKIAKKRNKEIPEMIEKLQETRNAQDTFEKLLGYGYSHCALLHAQGVSALRGGIFDQTEALSKSKKDDDRCLACFIFAGLSLMFKSTLEPSLPRILPVLLELFGDRNEKVRSAAEKATQSIVRNLTHACVERVLPYALNKAQDDSSWRVQEAAILLVEAVLKNNPKNISKYIPNIVSSLGQALKSPSSSVRDHATHTIEMLRSSFNNSAVYDIFPFLIQAISNPSQIGRAIEKITHLNLTAKLDAAALSVMIPIICNGCQSQDMNLKKDSLKVVGQLHNISTEAAIDKFSDELIPPLMNGVGDSSPNIRFIAASSFSSLVSCLKNEKYEKILQDLLHEMKSKRTFAERQGNAQAIASIIKTRGIEQLQTQLQSFVDFAKNSKDIHEREGYVSLLGFLAYFFGEEFKDCYDITIEAVLDACADPNDTIRTVGLRSASLITKTFSNSNPELILEPYFNCSLKQDWRQRLCAVNFMKSFVQAITGTTDADEKGIVKTIGQFLIKLEESVSHKHLYPALITLFILSADPVPTVSNEAAAVWRQIVPNTAQFLRKLMDTLLETITKFTCSESSIVRGVGACAMSLAAKKLKSVFIAKCFDVIENQLKNDGYNDDAIHGAVLCIRLLIEILNQDDKMRACTIIAPYLSSPFRDVREEALGAFVEMRNSLSEAGSKEVSSQLVSFVIKRAETDDDVSYLSGLLGVLGHFSLVDLTNKILKRPLNDKRPRIAGKIVGAAGSAIKEVMSQFSDRMISMSAHPPTENDGKIALDITSNVIEMLDQELLGIFSSRLVENMRSQQYQNRQAAILIAGFLLHRVSSSFNDIVSNLTRASIYLLDDPVEEIQNLAINTISNVTKEIPANDISKLIHEISSTLESLCLVSEVRAFRRPEAFESFNTIIDNAFNSRKEDSILSACSILSTVVPQLKAAPITTRKLLAHCVLALQLFSDLSLQSKILSASKALFMCEGLTERQILVNSLPMAYIRLFRSGTLDLQTAAADAMYQYAKKISKPIIVVNCLIQILNTQVQNVSSTVVNALISIVKSLKVSNEECNSCINALTPLLLNARIAMRELAARAIATVLLSSPAQILIDKILNGELLQYDDNDKMHTSIIILDEILKNKIPAITEKVLPFVVSKLPEWGKNTSELVQRLYPKLCITVMICNPSLTTELLEHIFNIIDDGEMEQQVIACQELQRLALIRDSLVDNDFISIFNSLLQGYTYGMPAVQSACATSLFDIFNLDEKSPRQLEALASKTNDTESSLQSFKAIIEQVQIDRANKKIVR